MVHKKSRTVLREQVRHTRQKNKKYSIFIKKNYFGRYQPFDPAEYYSSGNLVTEGRSRRIESRQGILSSEKNDPQICSAYGTRV